jgi:D-sedoheptulose 7-phosphate isomerase
MNQQRHHAEVTEHLASTRAALASLEEQQQVIVEWSCHLADVLTTGGRLLVCGNGGSAAQAQHLTAELVGRYQAEREPYSAVPLVADLACLTAVANDYGYDEVFARQVRAHGRSGDLLLAISTSGRSANVLSAVDAASQLGLWTMAMTGPLPNPLSTRADDALAIEAPTTAAIQEAHQVAIHLLCAVFDAEVEAERSEPCDGSAVIHAQRAEVAR